MSKTKIVLNDLEALETLLQENYDIAKKQIKQSQDELGVLRTDCRYKDMTPDEIAKISKAKKDHLAIINDNVAMLNDIAKLMTNIVKFKGDVDQALDASQKDNSGRPAKLNIKDFKKQLKEMKADKETYNIR